MDEGTGALGHGSLLDFCRDIAGGQRHRKIGADVAGLAHQVHAAKTGHVVVGYQQVITCGVGAQRGSGFVGVGEPAHLVAAAAQQALHQKHQCLVVIHIHDMVAALCARLLHRRGRSRRRGQWQGGGCRVVVRGHGKIQREPAPMAWRTVHIYRALMGAHHAMHHRQAQPCALAHGLGGEKRLKNAPKQGGVHARAVVAHRQRHIGGGCQAQPLAQAVVGLHLGGLYMDDAALCAYGMHGVGAKVQQGLLHLRGIGQQRRQVR